MKRKTAITIWNRNTNRLEEEKVYGDQFLRACYETAPGKLFTTAILSKKWASKIYGTYQSSALSQKQIQPFIKKFNIPMDEYLSETYHSFNDFFIRRFKPEARTFNATPSVLPAFAEARYLAYEKPPKKPLKIKSKAWKVADLLGGKASKVDAQIFQDGPVLIARLCPTDYHRFHFPDDGTAGQTYALRGKYHSVNPRALQTKPDILATNERQVTLLETQHFGRLAYIEVGALCVGKIVQTAAPGNFKRGQEKGYFLFGGSTVVVLGEKGKWLPDADLLEQSAKGVETLVRLGEGIGRSV